MRIAPVRPWPWILVVAAALVLWAHEVPFPAQGRLDAHSPFTLLAAMRVPIVVLLAAAAAGWIAAALLLARPVLAPVVLLLAAVASAVQIAPRVLGTSGPMPSGGPAVTILSANVLRSEVAPATLVALVRRTRAQVVALPEANAVLARRTARALQAATGRPWTALTDARGGPDDDGSARPTSLLVRSNLRPRRLAPPSSTSGAHGAVRVRLTLVGGRPMTFSAVHPLPPALLASQAAWRANLLRLRPQCRAGEVLAGDFNATLDHSPFRALIGAGCHDAASDRGEGLRATWTGGPLGITRPAIDHVLSGGRWRATKAGVLRIAGSDHRAVWARVASE
ncbi:endonuclease/exonuclease/phosphatase family protein [Patulibacter sp. NPDC049589]|uniref:endonuclease/exonuclease/phosphatase family protein n=1 Tax=Patulibacter sp. NPDC049589 TaxID=3154731 RepID=UPI003428CCC9